MELTRTRLESMLKVLDVDGAVRRVQGGWESTGADWAYDTKRYRALAEARRREQDAMLAYLDTDRCRMWFLRDQLDDEANWDADGAGCGRCDNCGGLTLGAEVSAASVDAATERLARPGVVVEPRKMWPTALSALGLDLSGRIADPPAEGGPSPASPTWATASSCASSSATTPRRTGARRAGPRHGRRPRRLAAGVDAIVTVDSAPSADARRRPRRPASPATCGCRSPAASRSSTRTSRPVRER